MSKQRIILTLTVLSASLLPAATAAAGTMRQHNETLLRDS